MPTPRIKAAPEFSLFRESLSAVDGSVPTAVTAGINAKGFQEAILDITLDSGSLTDLDIEVLFWSERAGTFVSQNSAVTSLNMTKSSQVVVDVNNRIFWVKISAMTGTTPVVSISVAGNNPAFSEA